MASSSQPARICPAPAIPLKITIVCRRNEANDNAGFKLVYESTSGFKTGGGWFAIPDNKEQHTATFRPEDP